MGRYKEKQLHFIGIGGVGMSAIADILLERGYRISGSDIAKSDRTEQLEAKGAKIAYKQVAENITDEIDVVVLSSAIHEDNEEYQAAVKQKKEIVHRADMLAYLMEEKKAICVAGSHGKTTTSSMISLMLWMADVDPTVIVGGEIRQMGSNARFGKSEYLVAEADESDGSFVKLHPWISMVTNIEEDHLDHYANLQEIKDTFAQFIGRTGEDGISILCADCKEALSLKDVAKGKVITYGFSEDAMVQGRNWRIEEDSNQADIYYDGAFLGTLKLQVYGKHNMANAIGAVACGLCLGLDFDVMKKGLAAFIGAKRRFQVLSTVGNITVVDDYAHHPTEVRATIEAALDKKPSRLICVFQPHRYSRTKFLAKEFAACFKGADQVILTDVYAAGETPMEGVSSQLILDYIDKDIHASLVSIENLNESLLGIVREGDMVLAMGAGNIWRNTKQLAEDLEQRYAFQG